jgi:hypothetical protein
MPTNVKTILCRVISVAWTVAVMATVVEFVLMIVEARYFSPRGALIFSVSMLLSAPYLLCPSRGGCVE